MGSAATHSWGLEGLLDIMHTYEHSEIMYVCVLIVGLENWFHSCGFVHPHRTRHFFPNQICSCTLGFITQFFIYMVFRHMVPMRIAQSGIWVVFGQLLAHFLQRINRLEGAYLQQLDALLLGFWNRLELRTSCCSIQTWLRTLQNIVSFKNPGHHSCKQAAVMVHRFFIAISCCFWIFARSTDSRHICAYTSRATKSGWAPADRKY